MIFVQQKKKKRQQKPTNNIFFQIFLATLSTTNKNHSRSKSSTLPVSGRKKPSTLNIHSNANTLISSSLTPSQKKFQLQNNTSVSQNFQNANKNVIANKNTLNNTNQVRKSGAQSLSNKTIDNKNIQNKQLKLNNKPTNFIGVLNDNSLANDRQLRNSKKKALESK